MHEYSNELLTADLYFVDLFDLVLLVGHQLGEGREHLTKLRLKGGVFLLLVPMKIPQHVT